MFYRGALTRRAAFLAAGALTLAPGRARAEWLRDEIVVYAEPPLRPVLAAMAAGFRAAQGIRVRIFCTAPGQMLALLAHATQDDILIAQSGPMAQAFTSGLTGAPSHPLWRNRLVFAAVGSGPAPADFTPTALARARIALPDPSDASTIDGPALLKTLNAVPAGIVGAYNTEDAVAALKRGDATMALCHASEAAADPSLRVVLRVPDAAYPPITYEAALSVKAWSRYQDAFLTYFAGPAAETARTMGLEVLA